MHISPRMNVAFILCFAQNVDTSHVVNHAVPPVLFRGTWELILQKRSWQFAQLSMAELHCLPGEIVKYVLRGKYSHRGMFVFVPLRAQ